MVSIRVGMEMERNDLLSELVRYSISNVMILISIVGHFEFVEMLLRFSQHSREEQCIRIEFFGDEIDRIREVDALTGEVIR